MKPYLYLIGAVALLALTSCTNQAESNIGVRTVVAEQKSIATSIDIAGVFAPYNSEKINSKLSGIVNAVNADVGQFVNVGDTLVALDTKDLEAQLAQAKAAYDVTKDQAAVAKTNYSAAQVSETAAKNTLNATKSVVQDQITQAKINVEAAQKGLASATEQNTLQLQQASINLDNAQKSYDRIKILLAGGSATKVDLETAEKNLDVAKNQMNLAQTAADASLTAAQAKFDAASTSYQQATGSSANSQIVAAESGVASAKSKTDTAKTQYSASSSSALEQAQANINTLQTQLSNATMAAHISGVVVNRNINEGELAQPGSALLVVADVSKLKLNGTIPQQSIPYVAVGQAVDVYVDIFPDKPLKGTVESVGPISVSTGSYFPIQISVDNADKSLMPGLSAHATIGVKKDNTVLVPSSVIVENNGQAYVFVVENGVAVKKNVVMGLKNTDSTEILSGLTQGEQVAATNVNTLFDQMPVEVYK